MLPGGAPDEREEVNSVELLQFRRSSVGNDLRHRRPLRLRGQIELRPVPSNLRLNCREETNGPNGPSLLAKLLYVGELCFYVSKGDSVQLALLH